MDTFFEQIIPKRKTPKDLALLFLIWFAAVIIFAASILFLLPIIQIMAIAIGAAGFYGAWFLGTSLNVEFEYSVTNGYFDIDKIVARRKRKREVSLECKDVEAFGKYNQAEHTHRNYQKRIIAGDETSEDAWYASFRHKEFGMTLIVFEPDERILGAIKKFLPKLVAKDAFGRY